MTNQTASDGLCASTIHEDHAFVISFMCGFTQTAFVTHGEFCHPLYNSKHSQIFFPDMQSAAL